MLTVIPAPLSADLLRERLAQTDAAAIMKLGRHFAKVRGVLEDLGLSGRSRYVERATMANQRLLPLDQVDADSVPYFSMVLVHRRGEAWA